MEHLNEALMAEAIAGEFHATQRYGSRSYMYHLHSVALSLGDTSIAHKAVAYLHDILEDTDCDEEFLREKFSEEIVDAVVAITKVQGEDYFHYLQRVINNKIAHTVKIHDTLCNLTESVKTEQWRRVDKYANQLSLLATVK